MACAEPDQLFQCPAISQPFIPEIGQEILRIGQGGAEGGI